VLNCLEADLQEVVNASLVSFPIPLKTAVVKPLLKKSNLDKTILSNYRLISNLPFIGKIIEKVVFNQLNKFLSLNGYFDNFQSGLNLVSLNLLTRRLISGLSMSITEIRHR